jgi:hypothetical protein
MAPRVSRTGKEGLVLKPVLAVAVLGLAAAGPVWGAAQVPGIPVGAQAPKIEGTAWFTADGKAPDLTGKAHLVYFWFEG